MSQLPSSNERSQSGADSETNAAVEYLSVVAAVLGQRQDRCGSELRRSDLANDKVIRLEEGVEALPEVLLFQRPTQALRKLAQLLSILVIISI